MTVLVCKGGGVAVFVCTGVVVTGFAAGTPAFVCGGGAAAFVAAGAAGFVGGAAVFVVVGAAVLAAGATVFVVVVVVVVVTDLAGGAAVFVAGGATVLVAGGGTVLVAGGATVFVAGFFAVSGGVCANALVAPSTMSAAALSERPIAALMFIGVRITSLPAWPELVPARWAPATSSSRHMS